MAQGILTPAQVKQIQEVLVTCGTCRAKTDYLQRLGVLPPETRDRLDHLQQLAQAALEYDKLQASGSLPEG